MAQKVTVDKSNAVIKVSVQEGNATYTQDVTPKLIRNAMKDFSVSEESATQFLIVYTVATLKNLGDKNKAQAEFLAVMLDAVKNDEEWAVEYLASFAEKILPVVSKTVKKTRDKGGDAITAVSVALDMPMEGARSFVACADIASKGKLTSAEIVDIMTLGIKGVASEDIAAKYGIES